MRLIAAVAFRQRSVLLDRPRQANDPAGAALAEPTFGHQKAHSSSLAMGLPMFLQQILHRRHIQHLVCNDPLQLGVLGFQRPQTVGIASLHSRDIAARYRAVQCIPPYFLRQL